MKNDQQLKGKLQITYQPLLESSQRTQPHTDNTAEDSKTVNCNLLSHLGKCELGVGVMHAGYVISGVMHAEYVISGDLGSFREKITTDYEKDSPGKKEI